MTEAYSLEARMALVSALRDDFPTPNEPTLMLVATKMCGRLDEGGWEIRRKPYVPAENPREEENRSYRPETVTPIKIAAMMATIMGMLGSIIDWQTRVDELVENHTGIVVSP
jgi:hypothetical protein